MCAAIADADVGADADADAETHGSRRLSFYVFVPACHVSMGKVRAIKKWKRQSIAIFQDNSGTIPLSHCPLAAPRYMCS